MNNCIILKVQNASFVKIISKLEKENIDIHDIKYQDNVLYLKISASDYSIVKKSLITYDVQKITEIGPKHFWKIINKYRLIIISIIISVAFIIFTNFFIVDIEVIHEDENLVSLIYDELEYFGIKKYRFRKKYDDLQLIKKQIKNKNLDKIDWLEISKVGMKYVVRVEERVLTVPQKSETYCAIYAKKDGLIKKIKVYDGEGTVNIHEYVKKDALLISGDIKRNDEIVDHTCANGKVYAEVWYTVNIKMPLKYKKKNYTGKKRYNFIVNYNGIDYKIFKDRLKKYDSNQKEIFNLLGIKIFLQTDKEIKDKIKVYSEKEALNEAISKATEKVKLKLDSNDKIISQKILQKVTNNSTMDIDIFIVAEEEIGYQVVLKEEKSNDL